jgi:hypothetical protein
MSSAMSRSTFTAAALQRSPAGRQSRTSCCCSILCPSNAPLPTVLPDDAADAAAGSSD